MSTFTPQTGFAQSTYKDQMGSALPGQLVNASDVRLVDTYIVDPAIGDMGMEAGLAFVATPIPADQRGGFRDGMNMVYASAPVAATTAEEIGGITVRNQQMDTNSDGHACWNANRLCNGLRAARVGGRIWVQLSIGTAAYDDDVYVIVANTTNHNKPIGSFSADNIATDTIALTGAKFKSDSDASTESTIAIVELGLEA